MINNIKIYKQSSVKMDNIYIDPYGIDEVLNDAKYIFITHSHYDHYSTEDIDKIINDNTIFIMPLSMKDDYKYSNKALFVEPGNTYKIDDIEFSTIAMYNINKQFHKKEYNWCGYNIKYNNELYYFVGDSDDTEEIRSVECNYIFIPIGGTYTMDLDEAINALSYIKYDYVIPYHYGSIVGDISLGNKLKEVIGDRCIVKIK